jgi:beta-phosphoglucomutase-like phosphatase (HAD superfamily)
VAGCALDAVIFDLDGVLLDSEPIYLAATNEVLAREGRMLSSEEGTRYSGVLYVDMLADLIPRLGLTYDWRTTSGRRAAEMRALSGPLDP